MIDMLVLPPTSTHAKEYGTQADTARTILEPPPEYLCVHELVHHKAYLLPEECEGHGPEIVHPWPIWEDHRGKGQCQQRETYGDLAHIEP